MMVIELTKIFRMMSIRIGIFSCLAGGEDLPRDQRKYAPYQGKDTLISLNAVFKYRLRKLYTQRDIKPEAK